MSFEIKESQSFVELSNDDQQAIAGGLSEFTLPTTSFPPIAPITEISSFEVPVTPISIVGQIAPTAVQ